MIRAIEFSNKRVGSTFFQNALNNHPDIKAIDEVFINMALKPGIRKSGFVPYIRSDVETPQEYIEYIIYRTYSNINTIFKLKYNQISYHYGLLQYIIEKKIPMINLQRRNLVKQVISFKKMAEYNHDPVVISGKELLNEVKEAKRLNEYWSKQLKDNIKLTLCYEDVIGEVQGNKTYIAGDVNTKLCNFFKVKDVAMFSTTKKKNKNDLSVYLPNIEDIKRVFKGSEFEWMLEE